MVTHWRQRHLSDSVIDIPALLGDQIGLATIRSGEGSHTGGSATGEGSSESGTGPSPDSRQYLPPRWGKQVEEECGEYEEESQRRRLLEYFAIGEKITLIVLLFLWIGAELISEWGGMPDWKKLDLKRVKIWKWVLAIFVTIGGFVVCDMTMSIVLFIVNKTYICRGNGFYLLKCIKKPLTYFFWLSADLFVMWYYIFDEPIVKTERKLVVQYHVTKVFICLIVATLLVIVKIIIIQSLLVRFYRRSHFRKSKSVLFSLHLLETVLNPPPDHWLEDGKPLRFVAKGPARKGSKKFSEEMSVFQWRIMNARNVGAWRLSNFINLVRYSRSLRERLDKDLREIPSFGAQTMCDRKAELVAAEIIREVFKTKECISLSDLEAFMPRELAAMSKRVIQNGPKTTEISRADMKEFVVRAFRQTRALELSLKDTDRLVNAVDRVFSYAICVLILIISLIIILNTTAAAVLFAFVVSNSAVLVYFFTGASDIIVKCLMFIFIRRSFDVGDVVQVNGNAMQVDKISLLDTVFVNQDNKLVQVPNVTLLTEEIPNLKLMWQPEDVVLGF